MAPDMPGDTLPAVEHEAIRGDIRDYFLFTARPVEAPVAIVLAGQPGAGKSALADAAEAELAGRGRAVLVDTDELREIHPGYAAFMAENDRTAADRVQRDAGAWADGLIRDTVDGRRNLIIDGTLKTPDNAVALCRDLRARGYRIEVRALAVGADDSRLGIHARYHRQRAEDGHGRWTPGAVHDAAYDGMLHSIERLEREGLVDRMTVLARRHGHPEIRYDNPAAASGATGAAEAIRAERVRERGTGELAQRADAWASLMAMVRRDDPGLREPENAEARRLAETAQRTFLKARTVSADPGRRSSLADRLVRKRSTEKARDIERGKD